MFNDKQIRIKYYTVARDNTWILPSFNEVNCIPKRFSGFANDVMNLKFFEQ